MPIETSVEPSTITIPARFCGPVASANGGYVSGLIAHHIFGPATVTLKAPPPLDVPLTLEHIERGKSVRLMYGEQEIATANTTTLSISVPKLPTKSDLEAARKSYLDIAHDHPVPGCFVCGPDRVEGDGMRIFAGAVPDSPVNADTWTPAEEFAGADGNVREEFLWAALDCPSAWATRVSLKETFLILGQMSAKIHRAPAPGEKLIVAAWPIKNEGRKHFSCSALIDETGQTIAVADALWFEITDPGFLQLLKTGK